SVRDRHGLRSNVREKFTRRGFVPIIFGVVPITRRGMVPNNHAARLGIEIGIVRRDVEIDVYRRIVGMYPNGGKLAVRFETRERGQWVRSEHGRVLAA